MQSLQSLRACRIRRYSTASIPPLPAIGEWRKIWDAQVSRGPRVTLANQETGNHLVDAFFPPKWEPKGKGKIVIEAFSGPGVLTRALIRLPPSKIRKLIVLENNPNFFQFVKELEAFDPRVKALLLNSHEWDSYQKIEADGLLSDMEPPDWQSESEIEFVATIPHSVSGEQLVAQLLRAIPERTWLFKHGRMRMNLLMPEQLYNRIDAPIGKSKRCKLSVIAEATARFSSPISPMMLRPYDDHFWPPSFISKKSMPDTRKRGHPMVAASFEPLKDQIISPGMLDKWDYCLRRLFVLKAYELKKALPSLAPGANNLIPHLQGPDVALEQQVDIRKRVNAMDLNDWHNIVRVFSEWPFAPDMLFIRNSFMDERQFY